MCESTRGEIVGLSLCTSLRNTPSTHRRSVNMQLARRMTPTQKEAQSGTALSRLLLITTPQSYKWLHFAQDKGAHQLRCRHYSAIIITSTVCVSSEKRTTKSAFHFIRNIVSSSDLGYFEKDIRHQLSHLIGEVPTYCTAALPMSGASRWIPLHFSVKAKVQAGSGQWHSFKSKQRRYDPLRSPLPSYLNYLNRAIKSSNSAAPVDRIFRRYGAIKSHYAHSSPQPIHRPRSHPET
ncbi:hypothetical protein V8C40DRAFT_60204 [Trichoderma camerunense]